MRRLLVSALLLPAMLAAQSQSPRSQPGWPCVQRAVDPAYVRMAERTGGQVFLFDRSEAGRSLVLMRETRKHEDVVFRAMGTLPAGYRDFQFPVDTTVESLLLAVSLQCLQSIQIYRPSGAELRASDAGVDDNQYHSGRILTFSRPEPGTWRIRIAGAGLFFTVVRAKSEITLDSAQFVEVGGRPGHEGYFPVTTPLRLNAAQKLSVRISGAIFTVLRLVDSAGATLQRIERDPASLEAGDQETPLTVTPSQPDFRVVVEGRDASGFPFQRVWPRLFQAGP